MYMCMYNNVKLIQWGKKITGNTSYYWVETADDLPPNTANKMELQVPNVETALCNLSVKVSKACTSKK